MAITALGLSTAIKDELGASVPTSSLSVHTAWANGIMMYLKDNLLLEGTYTGTTNTVPPVFDPKNGVYQWGVSLLDLTGESLFSAVSGVSSVGAFGLWVSAIEFSIKGVTFTGLDISESITMTPGLVLSNFSLNLTQEDIRNCVNLNEIVDVVSERIINSVLGTNVSGFPPSQATSSTPGSGSVAFASLL